MMRVRPIFTRLLALALCLAFGVPAAGAPLDQPSLDTLAEARRIVQDMIADSRGPYSRIRWYCNDGTTQPPVAYACRDRGGGHQHAEYSPRRQRLAELGWSVGTIFTPLTLADLLESRPRQQRLRELALEQYLVDVDNGWVLRRARSYRGRVQIEDEEANGRRLMLGLLADGDFALRNYLLMRESARVIPHGEDSDIARSIRRAAVELAELDPAAERWRAEIHSAPDRTTALRLRTWLEGHRNPDVVKLGRRLADDMDVLYGDAGRRARIDASLRQLPDSAAADAWRSSVVAALGAKAADRITALCNALAAARRTVFRELRPQARLALLDALPGLETEIMLAYQTLEQPDALMRSEHLHLAEALLGCAYGSGLLSDTEFAALDLPGRGARKISLREYRDAVSRLRRAPAWAVGTIRHTFAEALTRYTALDPRAGRFTDDLLRSSPMFHLGTVLSALSRDVDRLSGSLVEIDGRRVATAVALNSGAARGRLKILDTIAAVEEAPLTASDIVVIPETIAELSPVAGILTLGEGNALSHVQLLARNFGIPNVAIDPATVELLRPLAGADLAFIVDHAGNVLLVPAGPETTAAFASSTTARGTSDTPIEVPVPDLGVTDVLALPDIRRHLSGKIIGPKAANLGELNHLFPGRVAPALAIPFGIYAAHLRQAGLMQRIAAAYADVSKSRDDLGRELADIRARIGALALLPETHTQLRNAMAAEFGEPGTYGVFVRSDTNVEDLPQFTGAGLNETVPNVVGLEAQLKTVPRVWASVLSPRALAWRSSVLKNPERVFASVLFMKSVAATKSGVLVTANLVDRSAPGMTASTAWGIGGAVAGEAAETLVIHADRVDVVFEAKAPYRRRLAPTGGVDWIPAPAGPVLESIEIGVLRALAAEVNDKYEAVSDDSGRQRPWDIEFGFVDGELTLFQIRPLVEKDTRTADTLMHRLRPGTQRKPRKTIMVDLMKPPRLAQ